MMFQAWDSAQVINTGSGHAGRAGNVVRVEQHGENAVVHVRLDAEAQQDAEVVAFDASELVKL